MPKTPGKIYMYDVVKIDTIVFEIVEINAKYQIH